MADLIGPCADCGQPCRGEVVVGTIAMYVCPPCSGEADANEEEFLARIRTGDIPENGGEAT